MCLVFAIIISLLSVKSCASDNNMTCDRSARKPTNEILHQMYNKWLGMDNSIDSTYDLLPSLYKSRYKNIVANTKGVFRHRIYGRPKCDKKLRKTSGDLMESSLCPWYVEMTYDSDRYPEMLASAICKCKHCYNFNGERSGRSKRFNIPKCKEIKQMIKVLRVQKDNFSGVRVCQSNNNQVFSYTNSYEEITVGCTCALYQDKRMEHRISKIQS